MSRFAPAEAPTNGPVTLRQPTDGPVTLHQVMQQMIARGLKAHYDPPRKLTHELFVLLMQVNENDRQREAKAAGRGRFAAKLAATEPRLLSLGAKS
jgi:hypothetical protein